MGKKGKCRIVRTRSLTVVCSGECAEVSRAPLLWSRGRSVQHVFWYQIIE